MHKTLLALGLLLMLAACSKNDATNPTNTTDVADAYVGNWKVTDTTHYVYVPGNPDEYNTNTGSVTKTGSTGIRLNNFFTYLCPRLNASVTATSVAPINDSTCTGINLPGNFVAAKSGTTITFSYTAFGGDMTVRGKAEKQ